MFKNRKIEVSFPKKSKKDELASDEPAITIQDVTTNAVTFTEVAGKKVLKLIAVYIALDTARKIAVSRLG